MFFEHNIKPFFHYFLAFPKSLFIKVSESRILTQRKLKRGFVYG